MTQRTADNAPTDRPILVWVRDKDVKTGKPIGWRMGRAHGASGTLPAELRGDGMNGDWDVPFWHPLPADPE